MSVGSIDINLAGVLLAGVASMVIGMLYYSDAAFGKKWKKLAKIDEKRFQKEMPKVMPFVFFGALVTAYIIGFVTCLYESFYVISWMQASLMTAFVVWVVVAVNIAIHNALDQRPLNLTLISLGNRLLSIVAMGAILGWLHS